MTIVKRICLSFRFTDMVIYLQLILFFFGYPIQTGGFLVDESAKFKIRAPGVFLEKYKSISTDIGDMDVLTYYHQPEDEAASNYLYLINYIEYPEGSLHHDSLDVIDELFKKSKEEFILSVGAKSIYESKIGDEEYPTYLFRSEYNEGFNIVKSKMIVYGHRFYFLQVFTTKPNSLNKEMDQFLESFTILD